MRHPINPITQKFRQSHAYTGKYGQGSVRYGRTFDLHQSSRNRSKSNVTGARSRLDGVRAQSQFSRKSLPKFRWSMGGNALSTAGHRLSRTPRISHQRDDKVTLSPLLSIFSVSFLPSFLSSFRDKLAPVKLNRYKDDLLFYMFYTNVGDVLQLAAAAEL